jgi:Protein of unknown function (DUF1501)
MSIDPDVHRLSRRDALLTGCVGVGSLAVNWLLAQSASASIPKPHHAPRAKSIIFLFMEGGPSHIDLFDPKPELNKLHGQQLPASFKPIILAMGENGAPLSGSKRVFKRHGQSGTWVSDWLPKIAKHTDDITVIRSCWADGINHSGGVCQMNTGSTQAGRPSLGSWVSYGLGSENQNLPTFVVMQDNNGVVNGPRNWGAGFIPATHQGTLLENSATPIPHLSTPDKVGERRQQAKLKLLDSLNREHLETRTGQTELDARIRSYELAFRMQAEAPDVVDLKRESQDCLDLYGVNQKHTDTFARQCLLARRLVERGVRFVQLYHGAGSKWDGHKDLDATHGELCKSMDQPVAALLTDLKRRGLLDSTLVVWGGEFGRTPHSEQGNGRDHNPYGFTMWMAGAGVKGGTTHGATDAVGLHAVENRLHVHDLHATMLYALGLDNMKLNYLHKGRPERPTLNEGEPYTRLFAG